MANPLSETIQTAERHLGAWLVARNEEEVLLRAKAPSPRDPAEISEAEEQLLAVRNLTLDALRILDEAEAVPRVAALRAQWDVAAAKAWALFDALDATPMASERGQPCCPLCGGAWLTMPSLANRSEYIDVCTGPEPHSIRWSPLGG